ncbi:MAG TPA: MmcQ/YjbR family DNA-binding protein [Polyangiaceae bacterium]|nr:MmcQ/YjbR family DNA-binding protein [Polyangiaceae bacterium]HMR77715.1 MmcQ/YjbR family DNA-binding protein [Polyangiaceae bacterium]
MPPRKASDAVLLSLRKFGLALPGAHTKSPWPGHLDLAVNDKTFAYLSLEGEPLSISCKLPHSQDAALMLSFTKPTGYGLGRSGWVTATFAAGKRPPLEMLQAWIFESYRAQAPKRLLKQLDPEPAGVAKAPARSKRVRKQSAKKARGGTKQTATRAASRAAAPRKAVAAQSPKTRGAGKRKRAK